jgi:hypothetical protein
MSVTRLRRWDGWPLMLYWFGLPALGLGLAAAGCNETTRSGPDKDYDYREQCWDSPSGSYEC